MTSRTHSRIRRAVLGGSILWLACIHISGAQAPVAEDPGVNGSDSLVWKRIVPELEKIRSLEDLHNDLPRSAIFRTDQKESREKINRVLGEAVGVLGISEVTDVRAQIAAMLEEQVEDEARVAALKERRISAPDEALFGDTVERIDTQIQHIADRMRDRERAIAEHKAVFTDHVRSIGLDLSGEQVDFLLSTVVGDSVVDIAIAFHNVKRITAQLEGLTAESLENIQIARRYYGMYTILLSAMEVVYESALREIDAVYLAEIEAVITRTHTLMADTRSLIEMSGRDHESALRNNLRAQQFTLDAAKAYRSYLEDQRKGISAAKESLRKDIDVAMNTYETVKISGDLLQVMRASEQLFDLLFDLQAPELRQFENTEMKREFEKLTTRLRQAER